MPEIIATDRQECVGDEGITTTNNLVLKIISYFVYKRTPRRFNS